MKDIISKSKSKFKPKIIIIAAMDKHGAIGKNNDLPWRCPEDMRHFVKLTHNKIVLMGRKTAESLPKPLKDRINLVYTRNPKYKLQGFITVNNLWEIKSQMVKNNKSELWVIGGGEIYSKFIKSAEILHISIINMVINKPDTYFPMDELDNFPVRYITPCKDPMITFWVMSKVHKTACRYKHEIGINI